VRTGAAGQASAAPGGACLGEDLELLEFTDTDQHLDRLRGLVRDLTGVFKERGEALHEVLHGEVLRCTPGSDPTLRARTCGEYSARHHLGQLLHKKLLELLFVLCVDRRVLQLVLVLPRCGWCQ